MIALPWLVGPEHQQQKQVKMTLDPFAVHAS